MITSEEIDKAVAWVNTVTAVIMFIIAAEDGVYWWAASWFAFTTSWFSWIVVFKE